MLQPHDHSQRYNYRNASMNNIVYDVMVHSSAFFPGSWPYMAYGLVGHLAKLGGHKANMIKYFGKWLDIARRKDKGQRIYLTLLYKMSFMIFHTYIHVTRLFVKYDDIPYSMLVKHCMLA